MSQTYDVSLNPEKSIIIETEISGGTTDYERLKNLPSINGVELKGDLSTEDLKIELPDTSNFATKEDLETKADKSEIPDVSEFATKSDLPIETNSNEPLKTISASSSSITINNEKYGTNYVYQAKTEKDDDLPIMAKSNSSTSSVNSSTNFCVDITMNPATGVIKCKDVIVNNESVATKEYVDNQIGSIGFALDVLNGEVI